MIACSDRSRITAASWQRVRYHSLAENPFDRLIDQVVAPDRRTIPVSGGDLLPDLEKRLLESGLLEEPAFLCLVAPSRRRVQVDQDQDADLLANRQQRIEPFELRVDPRIVGRRSPRSAGPWENRPRSTASGHG